MAPDDPNRVWRVLLGPSGVLSFVGGAVHPKAPTDVPFRDTLATMIADGAWVPSHALLAVAAALTLAGLLAVRRSGAWPAARRVLPFAMVASALSILELLFHTAAVVDKEQMARGEWGPVTVIHLSLAVVAYPLFGVAIAWLAWRLMPSWSLPLRLVSVIGIVGGIANAAAAVLTIVPRNPDFAFLFLISGVGISLWLTVLGLAGVRREAARTMPAPA